MFDFMSKRRFDLFINTILGHFFLRSAFNEKGFFPAIEYSSLAGVASAPDVIDSNNHHNHHHHHHHHRKK
jgi:hypothetical protein